MFHELDFFFFKPASVSSPTAKSDNIKECSTYLFRLIFMLYRNDLKPKTTCKVVNVPKTDGSCFLRWSVSSSDEPTGDGSAFFALRSCHQLLNDDKGEFFSPDYLCSNPPLWCNWTIKVDPGKRIHLDLEDLTPDDTCYLKQDQIHVDEPAGHFGGHKTLQKCWREAKYTSSSNTLYVVLLIGGWPSPPYRGFYGRYQAFGPLVVYNPPERFPERSGNPSTGLVDVSEIVVMNGEQTKSGLPENPSPTNYVLMHDYYDQASVLTDELPWEDEEVGEHWSGTLAAVMPC